jgi:FkbM family methyltransferase
MITVRQKMFLARVFNRLLRVARRLAGRGMWADCRRGGINWRLDLDEGIDLCIYVMGAYEPGTRAAYERVIREGDVVLDIGANIGAHTLHFARLVGPRGRVYAVEPTDYAARRLRANLELNPQLAGRVTFRQCFLIAGAGEAAPQRVVSRWPVGAGPGGLYAQQTGSAESLRDAAAVTADRLCEEEGIARLDFVKIDVDGHENKVLSGFGRTLERFRPTMLMELAPYVYGPGEQGEFDALVAFARDRGYRFAEANSGRAMQADAAQIRRRISPGCSLNCILFPTARGG